MKDVFGKELHVGDEVVYLRKVNRYTTNPEKCKIVGFTDLRVLLNTCDGKISPDRLIRTGSGMTGKEMLEKLGYEEKDHDYGPCKAAYLVKPFSEKGQYCIRVLSGLDHTLGSTAIVENFSEEVDKETRTVHFTAEEIHAMHYWLEEMGL